MINTKNINREIMGLTPAERKQKVAKLREEHEDYFHSFQVKWKRNKIFTQNL